jgi:hypothetical protein
VYVYVCMHVFVCSGAICEDALCVVAGHELEYAEGITLSECTQTGAGIVNATWVVYRGSDGACWVLDACEDAGYGDDGTYQACTGAVVMSTCVSQAMALRLFDFTFK